MKLIQRNFIRKNFKSIFRKYNYKTEVWNGQDVLIYMPKTVLDFNNKDFILVYEIWWSKKF